MGLLIPGTANAINNAFVQALSDSGRIGYGLMGMADIASILDAGPATPANVLPNQLGQGGKVLGTNGSTLSWVTGGGGGGITGLTSDGSTITAVLPFHMTSTLLVDGGITGSAFTSTGSVLIYAQAPSTGSTIGTVISTSSSYAPGDKLLSIRSLSSERYSFDSQGNLTLIGAPAAPSSLTMNDAAGTTFTLGFDIGGNLPLVGTTLSTPLAITSGGTGHATANTALNALLPSQGSHNAQFLTTDGSNTSWVANVGTLPNQSGQATNILQTNGTSASWVTTTSTFSGEANILNFGAQRFDPNVATNWPDNSPAFASAILSQDTNPGPFGTFSATIEVPIGVWYISEPIWLKNGNTWLRGHGREASIINASSNFPGSGITGANGFAGPMVIAGSTTGPTFGPDLFGGSGRSLQLIPGSNTQVILTDAFVWSLTGYTAFVIEGRVRVNNDTDGSIISSACFAIDKSSGNSGVVGFQLSIENNGGPGTGQLVASVNTNNGALTVFGSAGSMAPGTYDLSLNFDGTTLWVYSNGVLVGSDAGTPGSTIVQQAIEGINFGVAGNEVASVGSTCIDGWVQSFRMGNVVQHTGSGSYTPPTAAFAAVTGTQALYNFDLGDGPSPTAPFFPAGNVYRKGDGGPGPVPHYCRLPGGFNGSRQVTDLCLQGGGYGTAGIVFSGCFEGLIERVECVFNHSYGILHWDGASFYSRHSDCILFGTANIGYLATPYGAQNMTCVGGVVGAWIPDGVATAINVQPGSGTIWPHIYGGVGEGIFGAVNITSGSTDAEGSFPGMRCGALFCGLVGATTNVCNFQSNGTSPQAPNILISVSLGSKGWFDWGSDYLMDNGSVGHIEAISGSTITGPIVIDGSGAEGSVPWTTSPEIKTVTTQAQGGTPTKLQSLQLNLVEKMSVMNNGDINTGIGGTHGGVSLLQAGYFGFPQLLLGSQTYLGGADGTNSQWNGPVQLQMAIGGTQYLYVTPTLLDLSVGGTSTALKLQLGAGNSAVAGTTATINAPSGTFLLASGSSTFTLTNSSIGINSLVQAWVQQAAADGTCFNVINTAVNGSGGSVVFTMNATATGNTTFAFIVTNH